MAPSEPLPDPPSAELTPAEERRLLAAYRDGDRRAAERLVEGTYRTIWAALVRLTGGNADLAADLTQETYRRAWQALPRFGGRARLATWLYRIAYTTFLNHLRRPRPVVALDELPALEPADESPAPDELARCGADAARLRRAVLELDDDLRFAVTARYWAELSTREIARRESVTPGAMRKRLRRALAELGRLLEEETR